MHKHPPLILLQDNGYKLLTANPRVDDAHRFIAELQDKLARVGGGDLDVAVGGFANREDETGELARTFNQTVRKLCESRNEVKRLHSSQIYRAECLSTAGELAIGLSHEIRNLLSGIAGVIELADQDLPAGSPARAAVGLLRPEIAQINRILTDLLQASRPHLPEIGSADLNTTVEQAVALVRQQMLSTLIKIEFHKDDPNVLLVDHDIGRIYQVVLNLLLNAVQAIDGEGAIRVGTSILKGDAVITVVDTGRGIAPEHLSNIFQAFYTNKANGTGLGLSLARRTVEEHKGRIEVTSEVRKGSTFLVFLPLQQATAQCVAS